MNGTKNTMDKLLWMIKAIIAGFIAFIILNLLTCVYRGGSPSIADETMSTSVRHEPNSFFSYMVEGCSFGFHDRNGFNNAYPAEGSVDYLCMGSSQMEAKNVMPDKNCVYILNELLCDQGVQTGYAYNIGTSGEELPICISRLPYAIKAYRPQRAVIIETGGIDYSWDKIDEAMEDIGVGELLYSYNGIMGFIRELPFIRLTYIQAKSMIDNRPVDAVEVSERDEATADMKDDDIEAYRERITPFIQRIKKNAEGIPVIILYHPQIEIDQDGSLEIPGDVRKSQLFASVCEDNDVLFLDMSKRFKTEYQDNHIIPYGFANSRIGVGHLNEYGHKMIAEEVFKKIEEVQ